MMMTKQEKKNKEESMLQSVRSLMCSLQLIKQGVDEMI
jgi:hypothetical protein